MQRRSGFDRVAIVGVYLGAIVQAAQAALTSAPTVRLRFPMLDITVGIWAYVPLALITVSSIAWMIERTLPRQMSLPELKSANELTKTLTDATAQLVASHPKPPDPNAPKVFLPDSFTQRYLDLVSGGGTELRQDAMLRPHVGEWMRVEAELLQTTKRHDHIGMMLCSDRKQGRLRLWVEFHLQWSTHLAQLDAGEVVKLQAQVVDNGYSVGLRNAELL